MEQKIFYVVPSLFNHHNDELDKKVNELNTMGWKVESVFCLHSSATYGLVCTKIK